MNVLQNRWWACAALGFWAAAASCGELDMVRRGDLTVRFRECPKCTMHLRFDPDAKLAFVNLSRLKDGDPDAKTYAARREAMVARAFRLMRLAGDVAAKAGDLRRPLMGWSSWNTFGQAISTELILGTANAMATNGLKAAGYVYVNIDDGFFAGHDANGRLTFQEKKFPGGLKQTADGIHALGLKAGIYSDAGADACGGSKGVGLYGHDADDCRLYFTETGFDFIKVDYCGGAKLKLDERTRYAEIAAAIRATGRPVRFNVCRWAFPGTWIADIAESWRTTGDIRASWSSVKYIIGENLYLGAYAKTGHYNDMDMLEVGNLAGKVKTAFGKIDPGLTRREEATHFGMWCMLSSPLLLGCDVRTIDEETLELVTNPFLLTMNQNDLGVQGHVVQRTDGGYVLVKDADERDGTARFLALYNPTEREIAFDVPFATLDLAGTVRVLDLMERGDMGAFERSFAFTVPPHGAFFARLDASRRLDRKVYEAEDAFLSDYQELDDGRRKKLAHPEEVAGASCGVAVRGVGGRPSNDLVWKDLRVSQAGTYRFELACACTEARTLSVTLDGGRPFELSVAATGDAFAPVAFERPLAAGVHVLRLANASGPAPDIDCLKLVRR